MIAIDLDNVFDKAAEIRVYTDGEIKNYAQGGQAFGEILGGWHNLISGAHIMPAYGVSLNRETIKAVKSGKWVEFCFDTIYESGGMPYEKLLIEVKREYYGFNLIRYNKSYGYDGRCFYYDLNGKNMSEFYELLLDY